MKLEKATIENTKVGDKCYIEVEVNKIKEDDEYPIKASDWSFNKLGSLYNEDDTTQLYHLIQEEIPTLGEGVEMCVSINGVDWHKEKVIAKHKEEYCDIYRGWWQYARPIELTIEQKYEKLLKEHEELKQQLNK